MRILITGNMGYVGPCLVKHLMTNRPDSKLVGYDIGYFANHLTSAVTLPECLLEKQIFDDVRNIDSDLFSGFDAVVHLAAISNDPMGNRFESVTYDINYRSSINIAVEAKAAGVKKFIFASSCSMYGASGEVAKDEKSSLDPLTAYAKSKVFTENDLRPIADQDFKIYCLRFATACGMSDRLRLDLVLNDFVAGAIASNKITILSDGTPWRPLINVKDMALAIEWSLFENQAENDFVAINIGRNDWNFQVVDLAEAVAEVIPGIDININKNAAPDKRSYKVDFSYYERIAPDYQPKYNLKETIEELRDGLEKMQFKNPDFRESLFIRLQALNILKRRGLVADSLEWIHS